VIRAFFRPKAAPTSACREPRCKKVQKGADFTVGHRRGQDGSRLDDLAPTLFRLGSAREEVVCPRHDCHSRLDGTTACANTVAHQATEPAIRRSFEKIEEARRLLDTRAMQSNGETKVAVAIAFSLLASCGARSLTVEGGPDASNTAT